MTAVSNSIITLKLTLSENSVWKKIAQVLTSNFSHCQSGITAPCLHQYKRDETASKIFTSTLLLIMSHSEGRVLLQEWFKKKNALKVFLINTDQKRQIQLYWFQIRTNAKFGSDPKARLALGCWVNAASFTNCALRVHNRTEQQRSEEHSTPTPQASKIQLSASFIRNPLPAKPAWSVVDRRCSTSLLQSSAAILAYLPPEVPAHHRAARYSSSRQ